MESGRLSIDQNCVQCQAGSMFSQAQSEFMQEFGYSCDLCDVARHSSIWALNTIQELLRSASSQLRSELQARRTPERDQRINVIKARAEKLELFQSRIRQEFDALLSPDLTEDNRPDSIATAVE